MVWVVRGLTMQVLAFTPDDWPVGCSEEWHKALAVAASAVESGCQWTAASLCVRGLATAHLWFAGSACTCESSIYVGQRSKCTMHAWSYSIMHSFRLHRFNVECCFTYWHAIGCAALTLGGRRQKATMTCPQGPPHRTEQPWGQPWQRPSPSCLVSHWRRATVGTSLEGSQACHLQSGPADA